MKDYKFTPIILVQNKDGKIEITEEKLKEMLQDAYNNGYQDGKDSQPIVCPTYPTQPLVPPTSPTTPLPYWYDKPYCTGTGIPVDLSNVKIEGKV